MGGGEMGRILRYSCSILLLLLFAGCGSHRFPPSGDALQMATERGIPPAGIRVEHVRSVNSGLLLDVRYRIVDPELAGKALGRGSEIYLKDLATGRKLPVPNMPKVGKLRQLPVKGEESRVYWMLFNNAGGSVKPGDRVALFISGEQVSENTVE